MKYMNISTSLFLSDVYDLTKQAQYDRCRSGREGATIYRKGIFKLLYLNWIIPGLFVFYFRLFNTAFWYR